MTFPTEAARERAKLLLVAILDVAPPGHPPTRTLSEAPDIYRQLHTAYVAELRVSIDEAMQWWEGRIRGNMQRNRRSRERAERDEFAMVPVGPASAGSVIATVRRYWLLCAALNRHHPPVEQVRPEELVLGWLLDSQPVMIEVLGLLTYFPIGLDSDEQWI